MVTLGAAELEFGCVPVGPGATVTGTVLVPPACVVVPPVVLDPPEHPATTNTPNATTGTSRHPRPTVASPTAALPFHAIRPWSAYRRQPDHRCSPPALIKIKVYSARCFVRVATMSTP
ncbi:hypothetical protein [Nocardia sp. NPDC004722]